MNALALSIALMCGQADRDQVSAQQCMFCHANTPEANANPQFAGSRDLIWTNEGHAWDKLDQHSQAFASLQSDLGQQMGRRLGYPADTADAAWNACKTCHALDLNPSQRDLAAKQFLTEEGVGCAACHGAKVDWITFHANRIPAPFNGKPTKWRDIPARAKDEVFGQTDLRDPVKRTERCAACHVGNSAEGKVVTHAMYAAGHPPLPGFEPQTFSDAEPPHYFRPEKAPYFQKLDAAKALELFHYRKGENTAVRQMAVGSLVTLREVARLAGDEATAAAAKQRRLDFAAFDCLACHHELARPSWRIERGFAGRPGRPPMAVWPWVLPRVVLADAGVAPPAEFERFRLAFVEQPFGDAVAVADAAKRLIEWIDTHVSRLPVYDDARANALAEALIAAGAGEADFDAARQLAWAVRVTRGADAVRGLTPLLNLDLRSRAVRSPIADDIAVRLGLVNAHDPAAARAAFRRLHPLKE